MSKRLYIGNLPYSIEEQSLIELFSQFGTVESANHIRDRDTGRSKGFGFIEMSTPSEAEAAIEAMNGQDVEGRPLTVNEARPPRKQFDGPPRGGNRSGPR